jgi:pimeloyl-ACP methyl ester carboxylesterase
MAALGDDLNQSASGKLRQMRARGRGTDAGLKREFTRCPGAPIQQGGEDRRASRIANKGCRFGGIGAVTHSSIMSETIPHDKDPVVDQNVLMKPTLDRRAFLALTAAGLAGCATQGAAGRPANAMNDVQFEDVSGAPRLHMRRRRGNGSVVLYVHGATFPSALSVRYRFADGRSWEDALFDAGADVWALDFEGYGGSARPGAFDRPADQSPQPLRCAEAAEQIARAVAHIQAARGRNASISIIAHSWGTIPAARFATEHPRALQRLILFGPILTRVVAAAPSASAPLPSAPQIPAWRTLTVAEQLARFKADVPAGQANILAEPDLAQWGPAWLATDAQAMTRSPPAVQIPLGPQADIVAAWSGASLYDPARILCPLMIVRGAWDSLCTDADVARFRATRASLATSDVVIPRATHLMHLEEGRFALWAASNAFLSGADPGAAAARVRPA